LAKLTLPQLERQLFAAADILRQDGAPWSSEHLFGVVFLKRCSDVFEEAPRSGYNKSAVSLAK